MTYMREAKERYMATMYVSILRVSAFIQPIVYSGFFVFRSIPTTHFDARIEGERECNKN